jgi:hypothetical protein
MDRLKHRGELVLSIPEINEMKPDVFTDRVRTGSYENWSMTLQFDRCYARIFDNCRVMFVHFDNEYMHGRKEEVNTFYDDDQLVEAFKNHVEFLK